MMYNRDTTKLTKPSKIVMKTAQMGPQKETMRPNMSTRLLKVLEGRT